MTSRDEMVHAIRKVIAKHVGDHAAPIECPCSCWGTEVPHAQQIAEDVYAELGSLAVTPPSRAMEKAIEQFAAAAADEMALSSAPVTGKKRWWRKSEVHKMKDTPTDCA